MTQKQLATWLRKNPGEVYVPVLMADGVIHVRAHKTDLIKMLEQNPNKPAPWSVADYYTETRNAWREITLDVA